MLVKKRQNSGVLFYTKNWQISIFIPLDSLQISNFVLVSYVICGTEVQLVFFLYNSNSSRQCNKNKSIKYKCSENCDIIWYWGTDYPWNKKEEEWDFKLTLPSTLWLLEKNDCGLFMVLGYLRPSITLSSLSSAWADWIFICLSFCIHSICIINI